ncbi:LacI family DNA-binding transcriptional regulator [Mesorhizobium denitrificans]|uniref:LacI family DNA-binding transcriptional regulator n=1 Tax=Mesorhizobium denitrificans TaxID=2294114 RepID=UPI0026A72A72
MNELKKGENEPEARKSNRRGGGRPTIADVARLADVAAITVSRALRHPSRVSAELRTKIDDAVAQLGYVPDPIARALASARSDVVGVLVPSLTNVVFADVVKGIYDQLRGSSLQIQMGNTHYSALEEERLVSVFLSQKPSALIVAGIDPTTATRKMLANSGCPVVQIMETSYDPIDMLVGFSHFDGGREATRHLIDSGYRRIGFIGARMDPRTQRRLAGYRRAMEDADLFDPALITTTPTPSSVTLGGQLLADALGRTPDMDAIFCNNDDLALGALFECKRSSIQVPQRLGICGFNDLEMMAVAFPTLSSIRTPRYAIGQRAVQLLQERLADKKVDTITDLGFELRPRESTNRIV